MGVLRKLAQYEIREELGRGGAGIVYSAFDTAGNRQVAVKILNNGAATPWPPREMRAAALLSHTSIARIYQAGEDSGTRFIAMELIRGVPLDRMLAKNGPLPPATAIGYSRQILRALEAAHSAGVVHRDLKPSNIMIGPDEHVTIVDFGLAKVTPMLSNIPDGDTTSVDWGQVSTEGSISGTLAYMAPEQAEGKAVDLRADIFSFAAVFYEMLTAQAAFGRESPVATIVAVMSQSPVRPPAISPLLWSVLELAWRKNPAERWKNSADLAHALDIASANSGVSPPQSEVSRKSRRGFLLLSGGIIGAVGVGAFLAGRRSARIAKPTFEQVTFDSGEILTARFGPSGTSAYVSFRGTGSNQFEMYEIEFGSRGMQKLELPPAYIEGVSSKGELALILLEQPDRGRVLARAPRQGNTLRLLADEAVFAAWAPDGADLMTARMVGSTCRLEYPLGTPLMEAETFRGIPFQYANLSRDGAHIAYFRPEKLSRSEELCVVGTGRPASPARVLATQWANTSPLHWMPGNQEIWFCGSRLGRQDAVWSVGLQGREECLFEYPGRLVLQDIRNTDCVALAASFDEKSSIRIQGAKGGIEFEVPGNELAGLSDDGATVLAEKRLESGQSRAISVFAKDNRIPVHLGEWQIARLSRNGKFVAAAGQASGSGNGQRLMILPVGPGSPQDLSRPGFSYEVLDWSGDGKWILATGKEAGQSVRSYIISVADHSYRAVTPPGVRGEILSRDGRQLLIRGRDGNWAVMDVESGQIGMPFETNGVAVALTWHEDGKSVFTGEILAGNTGMTIMLADIDSGRSKVFRRITNAGRIGPLGITADGAHVAFNRSETNSTLYLIKGLREG